ncbi:MAG TPA: aldo/keto reductase [Bryobacteraceae bacterium]
MLYRTLGSTGLSVSIIGFGASPLGDVFDLTDPAEGEKAVRAAIDAGVNLFDVSPFYGLTLAEKRLGKALRGRRDKVVLATKCGRYAEDSFDFSARSVKASIENSLARLHTDYVDLLQAHDVEFGDVRQIVEETIPALRTVQKEGKARYIGITGYPLPLLAEIANQQKVDTILSYCRYNLLVNDLDAVLAPLAEAKGIGLMNASPLHMGVLTERGAPPWHPAPQQVKTAGSRVVELCRSWGFDAPVVALRFSLNYPKAASTLVGMSTRAQVEANLSTLDCDLPAGLLAAIEHAVAPVKNTIWPSGRAENAEPPSRLA